MQKQAENAKRIDNILNEPRTRFGLDFSILLYALAFSVVVFLVGSLSGQSFLHWVGLVSFPALSLTGYLLTKEDPQMLTILILNVMQASHYDPGKD